MIMIHPKIITFMVEEVGFSILTVDEQINFCEDVKNIVSTSNDSVLQVKPFITQFQVDTVSAREVNHQKQASEYTELINSSDSVRDNALIAFRNYLSACSYKNNAEWQLAANRLLALYRSHGWSFHSKGNTIETNRINSLNEAINNNPENKSALTTIDGAEWWNEVVITNDQFKQNIEKRDAQRVNSLDIDSVEVYKKMRASYFNLIKVIEGLFLISPDNELLLQWITQINQKIVNYQSVARSRQTRKINSKEQVAPEKEN